MTSNDADRSDTPRRTRFREPAATTRTEQRPDGPVEREPADARESTVSTRKPSGRPERDAPAGFATTRRGGVLLVVACVVAVLALAAAVVFAVLYTHERSDADELAATRRDVVSTAEQTAIDFSSYDYRRLDRDFAAVSARLTPTFRASYGKTASALKATLTQYQAVGTAKVLDAGLSRLTSTRATVIVFLDQTVTSKTSKTPTVDRNRIRVQLQKSGSRWLVSALDVR